MSTIAQIREHGRAIAMVDTETGEFTEKTLEHKGEMVVLA
jgi:hypothetical protein